MRTRTLSSGVSSASRPVFAVVMVVSFRRRGFCGAKRSARLRVEEHVQRLDPSGLDLDDIRAGDDGGAARSSGPPSQPSKSVMTDGNSNRAEHNLGRETNHQGLHRTAYRVATGK